MYESLDESSYNFRLSNIMCSSICSADEMCNAYKYLPANCSLVNATGLIGSKKCPPAAETVMINVDLMRGNKVMPQVILCPYPVFL